MRQHQHTLTMKYLQAMYEEISEAMYTSEAYFTVVMRDFNAKVGSRNGDVLVVGSCS